MRAVAGSRKIPDRRSFATSSVTSEANLRRLSRGTTVRLVSLRAGSSCSGVTSPPAPGALRRGASFAAASSGFLIRAGSA